MWTCKSIAIHFSRFLPFRTSFKLIWFRIVSIKNQSHTDCVDKTMHNIFQYHTFLCYPDWILGGKKDFKQSNDLCMIQSLNSNTHLIVGWFVKNGILIALRSIQSIIFIMKFPILSTIQRNIPQSYGSFERTTNGSCYICSIFRCQQFNEHSE